MGPSTTPPAASDAPAPLRGVRAGSLSPALLLSVKIVLGAVGLGACALLGAGGALLFKHFAASGTHAGPATTQGVPAVRAPAVAPPVAPSTVTVVPAPPFPTDAAASQAAAAPALAAAPSSVTSLPGSGDAPIDISPRAGAVERPAAPSRVAGKATGGRDAGGATSVRADKARCLATVNAITADLSLRNEPPTPQQLAILKRGCK